MFITFKDYVINSNIFNWSFFVTGNITDMTNYAFYVSRHI